MKSVPERKQSLRIIKSNNTIKEVTDFLFEPSAHSDVKNSSSISNYQLLTSLSGLKRVCKAFNYIKLKYKASLEKSLKLFHDYKIFSIDFSIMNEA